VDHDVLKAQAGRVLEAAGIAVGPLATAIDPTPQDASPGDAAACLVLGPGEVGRVTAGAPPRLGRIAVPLPPDGAPGADWRVGRTLFDAG